eukprot:CAMPEP_0202694116 /NCGR_PEP_ID=MMETSP1385-20130828/8059_1 /ASSEMBLY_ACC=CAM_ASM_000861 /TAXON_ID=933848 /ORGANISM="Elphidium margaritaceum" /LENGTH=196 /DNA_ID=CAMNT_0049349899 /DNA_START=20 /DNA_END=606 /DNA_ORIENTATION=+
MSRNRMKGDVVNKLLQLGFSFDDIGMALDNHTWIQQNEASNSQRLTEMILSKSPDTLYKDTIQLLDDGIISYLSTKKEIRSVLEQKYDLKHNTLKKNQCFDAAMQRISTDLNQGLEFEERIKSKQKIWEEWNNHEIVKWMDCVQLNGAKFECLRKQIEVCNLKGTELGNINDTTLKLMGIQSVADRELVLKSLADL